MHIVWNNEKEIENVQNINFTRKIYREIRKTLHLKEKFKGIYAVIWVVWQYCTVQKAQYVKNVLMVLAHTIKDVNMITLSTCQKSRNLQRIGIIKKKRWKDG